VGARLGPVWRSRSARDPVSNLSSDRYAKDRLKMAPRDKLTEQLALSILARDGIAAIWQLHLSAADAHRTGHPKAAQSILGLAEAAEEAWLRAEGARSLICCSKSS
jgi:hypothetical protein